MKRFSVRSITVTILILLLPLTAMQFTDEVDWAVADFLVGGLLLLITGLSYEIISARSANTSQRGAIGLMLLTALLLIWMNLAVGIIGSENNPANWIYAGVLAIPLVGSIVSRLKATSMVWVMAATAFAQILALLIAMSGGWGQEDANWPWNIMAIHLVFILLWSAAGGLFYQARGSDN